jgi:UDP-N-acetylmuramate dehydrogenase
MNVQGFEHIIRENELLSAHTWFRIGGPARYFAEPTNIDELVGLVARCRHEEVPVRLLGGGSNILVRDAGIDGVVIHLAAAPFAQIKVHDDAIVAGGAAKLHHLISVAVGEGLAGLETLVGIPGTVGGALHINAGTETADIGQHLASATVLTRNAQVLTRQGDDLRFAYQQSSLDELVILDACFKLERGSPAELTRRMQKTWISKTAGQPSATQNAGCIFKNPSGASAAAMIEEAGLRGSRVGDAEVSDRNANFIITNPRCKADDVIRLIELLRSGVEDRLGEKLESNIQIW